MPPSDVVAVVRTRGKAADLAARGVRVCEADYSRPQTLGSALAGADRLLLVSGNEPGQRVVHHTNVIGAARMARGLAHRIDEQAQRGSHPPAPLPTMTGTASGRFARLACRSPCCGTASIWSATDHLSQYLEVGEIIGAAGNGRISAASRQDYAAASRRSGYSR